MESGPRPRPTPCPRGWARGRSPPRARSVAPPACPITTKEKPMEIVILPDNQAIGSLGADAVEDLLRRKPDPVLGLATGSSPLAIYDELAHRYSNGRLSFAEARGFTLDEYVGLPA